MDWKKLYFGELDRSEIQRAINNQEWQKLRVSLKGKSLEEKYKELSAYLRKNNNSKDAQIRVTNYVTALSRGGLIKPSDYRS